jgi:hypothetical protein
MLHNCPRASFAGGSATAGRRSPEGVQGRANMGCTLQADLR